MAFSWFMPGTPKTLVEIIVVPTGGGSRVSLLHSGWEQFDGADVASSREALEAGWGSFVLPALKRVAEAP
jgi:hypothetical protein